MRIWNEPWLSDDREPIIQTHLVCRLEMAKVYSLKSINGKTWEVDILNELFCARYREFILKIPLSIKDGKDCWSWRLERRGDYSGGLTTGLRQILYQTINGLKKPLMPLESWEEKNCYLEHFRPFSIFNSIFMFGDLYHKITL